MRKFIIILLSLVLAVPAAEAQRVHKGEMLKSINLGNVKLFRMDNSYALRMRTDNSVDPYFTVELGSRERALEILRFLSTLKLGKDDVAELENETHNLVTRGPFGGFYIHSEGQAYQQGFTKEYAKKLIKVIEEDGEQ